MAVLAEMFKKIKDHASIFSDIDIKIIAKKQKEKFDILVQAALTMGEFFIQPLSLLLSNVLILLQLNLIKCRRHLIMKKMLNIWLIFLKTWIF